MKGTPVTSCCFRKWSSKRSRAVIEKEEAEAHGVDGGTYIEPPRTDHRFDDEYGDGEEVGEESSSEGSAVDDSDGEASDAPKSSEQ